MREQEHKRFFLLSLWEEIRQEKKAFAVFAVLNVAVIVIIVRSIAKGLWENVFTGVLALILLLIPPFIEKSFRIKLPATLEILAYLFVFASGILGEIGNFYQRFVFWDAMLHAFNGFMFAAFGFCLVDLFNRSKRPRFTLSPFFLALVAFCFSMTSGVLWEFFEDAADTFLHTDMQKDTLRSAIDTVSIPNALGGKVTHLRDITSTVIQTADGQTVVLSGYLDLGVADTMKDLFVNLVGAVLFSVIGYFYVKHRGKGRIANQFIPVVHETKETELEESKRE